MINLNAFSISQPASGGQPSTNPASIKVTVAPNLINISRAWAIEYAKLNPSVQININEIIESKIPAESDFSIVSNNKNISNKDWKMLIGRNAVVSIMNKNNPLLAELKMKGMPAETMESLVVDQENNNWGNILENDQNIPAKTYTYNAVLNSQPVLNNTNSSSELVSKIEQDIFAIGICNLSDLITEGTQILDENISIMPIDKNSNGRLDNFENIYGSTEDFIHGSWIGKYSKNLTENIYATAASNPDNKEAKEFLSWIISDGQRVLSNNGYITLTSYQEKSGMKSMTDVAAVVLTTEQSKTLSYYWIIGIAGVIILIVGGMLIYSIVRMLSKNQKAKEPVVRITAALDATSINSPDGIYYGKSHAWSFMEKDGTVRVGIDDFLQHVTGPISRVKMKQSGDSIHKGEKMLTINHDGKQLEIYAPVSGIIKEQNQNLNTNSGLVNNSPYGEGWIYSIIPRNWSREIEFMLLGQDYKNWLNDEFTRLKDFLARSVKTNEAAYQHIVLQDGGELRDNILADLEPKVWEDFQSRFLDISK